MHERDILLAALEKPQPFEREAYLAEACGGDAELRCRVEALLLASLGGCIALIIVATSG